MSLALGTHRISFFLRGEALGLFAALTLALGDIVTEVSTVARYGRTWPWSSLAEMSLIGSGFLSGFSSELTMARRVLPSPQPATRSRIPSGVSVGGRRAWSSGHGGINRRGGRDPDQPSRADQPAQGPDPDQPSRADQPAQGPDPAQPSQADQLARAQDPDQPSRADQPAQGPDPAQPSQAD